MWIFWYPIIVGISLNYITVSSGVIYWNPTSFVQSRLVLSLYGCPDCRFPIYILCHLDETVTISSTSSSLTGLRGSVQPTRNSSAFCFYITLIRTQFRTNSENDTVGYSIRLRWYYEFTWHSNAEEVSLNKLLKPKGFIGKTSLYLISGFLIIRVWGKKSFATTSVHFDLFLLNYFTILLSERSFYNHTSNSQNMWSIKL